MECPINVYYIVIVSLIVISYLPEGNNAITNEIHHEGDLYTRLFTSYSNHNSPIQGRGHNSTVVQVGIVPLSFQFYEKKSILDLACWTVLIWYDQRFTWTPEEYGNVTVLHVSPSLVWTPKLEVYKSGDNIDSYEHLPIVIYNGGEVLWVPAFKFRVYCDPDVQRWPYDKHECEFILGALAHNELELQLYYNSTESGFYMDAVQPNREWNLEKSSAKNWIENISFYPFPFYNVRFQVTLQRKWQSGLATVYGPVIALALLTVLPFFLNPFITERLVLILFNILIAIGYLQYLGYVVPNNGYKVPHIILLFRDVLIVNGATVIWTLLIRKLTTFNIKLENLESQSFCNILCLNYANTDGGGKKLENTFLFILDRAALLLCLIVLATLLISFLTEMY